MGASSLFLIFAIVLPSALSLSPPCEDQDTYVQPMLQCRRDSEKPGTWIPTNLDPETCEGYCRHFAFAPPCDQHTEGPYYQQIVQCSDFHLNPGVWVPTNLNPENCQGYCDYTTLSKHTI
jgi:hypothetical protein